jgi:hypothetical protein
MIRRFAIPEGLRVLPDGSWRVGELPFAHPRQLKFLKQRLTFDGEGAAAIVDGDQRRTVAIEGPPFQIDAITFDAEKGEVRLQLDDGTEETLPDPVVRMNPDTGRFECAVKGGRTRAVFSQVAHDAVLDQLEQDGEFYVPIGAQRCKVLP